MGYGRYGPRPWRWAGVLLLLAALLWRMPLERALACATLGAFCLVAEFVSLRAGERRRQLLTEQEWDRAAERMREAWWAKKQAADAAKNLEGEGKANG